MKLALLIEFFALGLAAASPQSSLRKPNLKFVRVSNKNLSVDFLETFQPYCHINWVSVEVACVAVENFLAV